MTSRERAEKIAEEWSETRSSQRPMADEIERAIDAAVAKAVEDCAKVAEVRVAQCKESEEKWAQGGNDRMEYIARVRVGEAEVILDRIRSRGTK